MPKRMLFLIIICLLLLPMVSFAETQQDIVVLLIIDQSGSMIETDPLQYRLASAGLLIDTMGANDQLGLLSFASEIELLHEISPVGENRQSLHQAIDGIGTPNGNTDYLLALQTGRKLLDTAGHKNKAIVFLTDGDPYPNDQAADDAYLGNYLNELDQLIEQMALENISVYTVGFGDSSGEILEPISQKTRALSFIDTLPQELAGNFFHVVTSLKGREVLVDETLAQTSGSYAFDFDDNTSQLNGLIIGEFITGYPTIEGADGIKSQGTIDDGYVHFVVDEAQLDKSKQWKLEVPIGDFKVFVTRDTKTYFEVLSPSIQSEFSEEAPIDLAVRVHAPPQELVVEARSLLNNESQGDWVSLELIDDIYQGQLIQTGGTGAPEVEFRARTDQTQLTSIKVPVRINRIPELKAEISSPEGTLVEDSEVVLKAWLSRNDKTLTSQVTLDDFRLVRESGDGTEILQLHDDGKDGDIFANDGIYSVRFMLSPQNERQGEIQAQGVFEAEAFHVSKILEAIAVAEPGSLYIELNHGESIFEDLFQPTLQLPITLENRGEYPELVTISANSPGVQVVNSLIKLEPNEHINTVLEIELEDQTSELVTLDLNFKSNNAATQIVPAQTTLSIKRIAQAVARQESATRLFSRIGPTLFSIFILGFVAMLTKIFISKKRDIQANRLTGTFNYRTDDGQWSSVPLKSNVFNVGIGETKKTVDLSLPGKKLGFVLNIRKQPGHKFDLTTSYMIECSLPGVIHYRDMEASSCLVKSSEKFKCGGYECEIVQDR